MPKPFTIGESVPFGFSFDVALSVDGGANNSCFHVETRSDSIGNWSMCVNKGIEQGQYEPTSLGLFCM